MMNSTVPAEVVIDRAAELQRRVVKCFSGVLRKVRRGRLFQHFLIVALDRAIALEQMHQAPLPVAGDLHFEMTRVENEFLEQHRAVAERRLGLGARGDSAAGEIYRRDRRGACPVRRRRPKP